MDAIVFPRLNTRERLAMLPAVFSLRDVIKTMGVNYQTACAYVNRWHGRYGLIETTGLKTGVFLNVEHMREDEDYLPIIMKKCLGSDVIEVGKTSLEIHGWIKEECGEGREFIIPATVKTQTLPTIYGAKLLRRPEWWFTDVLASSNQKGGIWLADPAMAFADSIISRAYYDMGMVFFPKPDIGWIPAREDLAGSEIRGVADLKNKIDTVCRKACSLLEHLGEWQIINVDIKKLLDGYSSAYATDDVDEFLSAIP